MNFISGNVYDVLTVDELISGDHGDKRIPDWKELDDDSLNKLSTLFLNPAEYDDDTAFDFTNSEYNYQEVFDEEYLRDKFPGFDDNTYSILKAESDKLNVQDMFIKPDDIPSVSVDSPKGVYGISADARRGDSASKP